VLLVDDVAAFRRLVATALRLRGGFEVVGEAANGERAVEVAAELRPDVAVLDLGLPDLTGTDLISAMRMRAPDTRIVIFTGRDVDFDARSVEAFVRKDGDVRLLVDVLCDIVDGSGVPGATLVLENDLRSASLARAFVEEQCRSWGLHAVVEDALLVVSELVTNAVVHARSASELRLVPGAETLRIEVADDDRAVPDPVVAGKDDEHGRGLLLVAVLSAAWGTEARDQGGKVVWADVPLEHAR
jgi:CheY-like chemotaxis protein